MVKWVSRENRGNSKKSAMTEVKDEVTFASQIQVDQRPETSSKTYN